MCALGRDLVNDYEELSWFAPAGVDASIEGRNVGIAVMRYVLESLDPAALRSRS